MTTIDLEPAPERLRAPSRPRLVPGERALRGPVSVAGVPVAVTAAAPAPRAIAPAAEGAAWVVHPHPVMRRGLVAALSSAGAHVVGESDRLVPRALPPAVDTLVFDSGHAAVEVAAELGRQRELHLICLMASPSEAELQVAAAAGVAAILIQEDLTPDALAETWRAARSGATMLPRHLLPQLLARAGQLATVAPHRLTPREASVLRLLSEGEDTRAIAAALCYSERTVKNVVHDVLTKLDCRTRAQAVGAAIRAGLI
ncbi:MAG: response regulator transcription factor [Kineosporiaceae bacterium]